MLRVRGIPQDWDASQLQSFFQNQVGLQDVVVESMASESGTNSLLASIAFQDLPASMEALRPGSGVQLLLPKQNEDEEDKHLTLDVDFVGFDVPHARNPNFVGSVSIVDQLTQQLGFGQDASSVPRTSLHGPSGIGKTQFALEFAYWIQANHPKVSVFWVDASSADRFRESFIEICRRCQIPGHDQPTNNVLSTAKNWLQTNEMGRWLMIVDNADDEKLFSNQPEGVIGGLLGQYLPKFNYGSLLITTKSKQVATDLSGGRPLIELGEMEDDHCQSFLHASLEGMSTKDEELSSLATRLGHMPLALSLAAAFIHQSGITVPQYLELLDNSDQGLVDTLTADLEILGQNSKVPRPVAETWIISFQQVEKTSALGGRLLSYMCMLDRRSIPNGILACWADQVDAGRPLDEVEFPKSLEALQSFRLIQRKINNTFDIHELIQLLTQKWLAHHGDFGRFSNEAFTTISGIYPQNRGFETRPVCSVYLPHAKYALRMAGLNPAGNFEAGLLLRHNVTNYLEFENRWDDAEKLNLDAVERTKKVLGEESPTTLTAITFLSLLYRNQGRLEDAANLGSQVLQIQRATLGPQHQDAVTTMGSLASIFWHQGRYDEAVKLETEVTEANKVEFGPEHPQTLSSMSSLARALYSKGELAEAEKQHQQVWEIRKTKLGPDHLDTLTSMNGLASVYHEQGRYEEAEQMHAQVMISRQEQLGPGHPDTLKAVTGIAIALFEQHKYDEAEGLQTQVLEVHRAQGGPDHPDTLASMNNLAAVYFGQGRYAEALEFWNVVKDARLARFGGDHPDTLVTMGNLAAVFSRQGKYEEAEKLELQLFEAHKSKNGADHPSTLNTMANLADTWREMGKKTEAIQLLKECISYERVKLGPDHPRTQSSVKALQKLEADVEDQ